MSLRLEKFNELLQDLSLYHEFHPILVQNGFDNWESISYLNAETLRGIGITDDLKIKEILGCVEAAATIKDEEEVLNESTEILKEHDLIEEMKHTDIERPSSRRESQDDMALKKQHPITEALILKGTSLRKGPKETNEKFYAKVIQLYLNEKGITHIDNLHLLPNLQALYLYNNNIEKISGLDSLSKLTQLNLQGNFIRKMDNLQNLKGLKKLNLSRNCITHVEGLEYCTELEELYISHQQIGQELTFDLTSLAVISSTLRVLEADHDHIFNPSALAYLSNLRSLSLKANDIKELETLERPLACMNYLMKLDIRENPVEKVPKIRDQIVMMSSNLETLNDKKILENERAFLLKFYNIKSNNQQKPASNKPVVNNFKQAKKAELAISGSSIGEVPTGKENQKISDGLNQAKEFYSNTVHNVSKKVYN